jgi:hypothetical protein
MVEVDVSGSETLGASDCPAEPWLLFLALISNALERVTSSMTRTLGLDFGQHHSFYIHIHSLALALIL